MLRFVCNEVDYTHLPEDVARVQYYTNKPVPRAKRSNCTSFSRRESCDQHMVLVLQVRCPYLELQGG